MRDIWQTTNVNYKSKFGLATCPRKLKSSGIKRLLERGLWEQGLRQPLENGSRRHEWKGVLMDSESFTSQGLNRL